MYKPFSRSNYATLMAADAAGLSWFTLEKLLYWVGGKETTENHKFGQQTSTKRIKTRARIMFEKVAVKWSVIFDWDVQGRWVNVYY